MQMRIDAGGMVFIRDVSSREDESVCVAIKCSLVNEETGEILELQNRLVTLRNGHLIVV